MNTSKVIEPGKVIELGKVSEETKGSQAGHEMSGLHNGG